MNTLIKQAIQTYEDLNKQQIIDSHERAKIRIRECFGEYAKGNLTETEKPCHFRIKNTQWDLVYGFFDGFTIWHKDYPQDKDFPDGKGSYDLSKKSKHPNFGKYNAWQIVDMRSLGESLASISKTWGL